MKAKRTKAAPATGSAHPTLEDFFSPTGRRMLELYCTLSNIQEELRLAAEAGNFDNSRAEGLTDIICGITEMIDFNILPGAIPLTRGLPPVSDYARADVPREGRDDADEATEGKE